MNRMASSIVAAAIAFSDPRPCRAVPGDVNGDDKLNLADPITLLYHLFCGGELKSPDPFCAELQRYVLVDNGDGTVSDLTTNLMWQKAEVRLGGWEKMMGYCLSLELGGYHDWRLPNIRELLSINQGKWPFDDNMQNLPPPPPLEGAWGGGISSSAADTTCRWDYQYDGPCVWGINGRADLDALSKANPSIGGGRAVRGGLAASVGDTNSDGRVDIGDAITLFYYLFRGGRRPEGPTRLLATGVTQSLLRGDNGDLRLGLALSYRDNGDGTVTDMNTGFVWDQKPPPDLLTASEVGRQYDPYNVIPPYADLLTVVDFSRFPAVAPEFELGEGVCCRFWMNKLLRKARASLDVYCLRMYDSTFYDYWTARVWPRRYSPE